MKNHRRHLVVLAGLILLAGCTSEPSALSSYAPMPAVTGRAGSPTEEGGCRGAVGFPVAPKPVRADTDGMHAAFLASIDPVRETLTYDEIQFLSGEEANAAYQLYTGETGDPPGDYYIVNKDSPLRTLKVSSAACLAIFETGDPGSTRTLQSMAELSDILERRSAKDWPPFWITLRDDEVIAVQQQWVP